MPRLFLRGALRGISRLRLRSAEHDLFDDDLRAVHFLAGLYDPKCGTATSIRSVMAND